MNQGQGQGQGNGGTSGRLSGGDGPSLSDQRVILAEHGRWLRELDRRVMENQGRLEQMLRQLEPVPVLQSELRNVDLGLQRLSTTLEQYMKSQDDSRRSGQASGQARTFGLIGVVTTVIALTIAFSGLVVTMIGLALRFSGH